MRYTNKERAKRKQLTADYLAFRIEHKRPGTGSEVTAWLAARDAAEQAERDQRKQISPEMKWALRERAKAMMAALAAKQ